MKTLVINCGSSSLKYQLIDMSTEACMVQGLVEGIGIDGSILTQKEYHKYMSQTKQAASVAHGGGKLCPDKDIMEVVSEGAKDSDFKFPKIDF